MTITVQPRMSSNDMSVLLEARQDASRYRAFEQLRGASGECAEAPWWCRCPTFLYQISGSKRWLPIDRIEDAAGQCHCCTSSAAKEEAPIP